MFSQYKLGFLINIQSDICIYRNILLNTWGGASPESILSLLISAGRVFWHILGKQNNLAGKAVYKATNAALPQYILYQYEESPSKCSRSFVPGAGIEPARPLLATGF